MSRLRQTSFGACLAFAWFIAIGAALANEDGPILPDPDAPALAPARNSLPPVSDEGSPDLGTRQVTEPRETLRTEQETRPDPFAPAANEPRRINPVPVDHGQAQDTTPQQTSQPIANPTVKAQQQALERYRQLQLQRQKQTAPTSRAGQPQSSLDPRRTAPQAGTDPRAVNRSRTQPSQLGASSRGTSIPGANPTGQIPAPRPQLGLPKARTGDQSKYGAPKGKLPAGATKPADETPAKKFWQR